MKFYKPVNFIQGCIKTAALVWLLAPPPLLFAQDNSPLSATELRETLIRLHELETERVKSGLLQKALADAEALRLREAELAARELAVAEKERQNAETLAGRERQRGDDLKAQLDAALKKRGLGHKLCRVFTLGMAKC